MSKTTWSRERTGDPAWEGFDTLPFEEDDRAWYVCEVHRERGLTLEEIGELAGLSYERVRQIQQQAMRKLRHRLGRSAEGRLILQQLMILTSERTTRGEVVYPEMTDNCDHRQRGAA